MRGNLSVVRVLAPLCQSVGVILIVLTVAACQISVKQYPGAAEALRDNSKAIDGVSVVAHPLFDVNDQSAYFGTNLSRWGVLPIYISIMNGNGSKSFVVDTSTIAVNGKAAASAVKSGSAITGAKQATGTGLTESMIPLLSVIGTVISINANIVSEAIELNMLRSGTVDPGQRLSGFYYAKLKEIEGSERNAVCVQMLDPLADISRPLCVDIEKGK